jgi:transmembrane sensor
MEDNKNLHIDNLNHGNYPEPDIPADEAWAQMKNLLQHVPVQFSAVKGLKLLVTKPFLYGISGLLIASATVWYISTNRSQPHAIINTYTSQNIPVKETLSNNLVLYLDSHSNVQASTNSNNSKSISINGAVYIETIGAAQDNVKIKAGSMTVTPIQAKIYVSYDTTSSISLVQVQSGKVILKAGNATITLTAGASAKYFERTGKFDQEQKLNVNAFGYATRSFEFTNTPLKEAADDIEKAYGVSIKFTSPALFNCRLTTRFDNKPLREVLDIMSYTLNFEYTFDQKNNQVTFVGDGCK